MSGILGLVDPGGAPLPTGHLQRMREAMAYWGPDGGGLVEEGFAGLGHLKLLILPEAVHEHLPLRHGETGLWFTASARLDDRDELCDTLGIPHPERPSTPDTTLLLLAWLKWGEDGLPNLRGDWSFALWDPRERRLVLARDPYGATALYYTRAGGRFAFASCKKALLALPEVSREPDELFLATLLVCGPQTGHDTAYVALKRVPPAHVMVLEPGKERLTRYWKMEESIPDVRLPSDDAYVETFLELFERAVASRLRSLKPIGTQLSGGLDSGSVTALAARQLGDRPLVVFTSVPVEAESPLPKGRFGNEWPMASQVARRFPNVEHIPIWADGFSPLDGLEMGLSVMDSPPPAAVNQYWLMAMSREACQKGIGVLLHGQSGNATISWTGSRNQAWDHLCAGRTLEAWRQLKTYQDLRGLSPWQVFRNQVLRPWLSPCIGRIRRAYGVPWPSGYPILRAYYKRVGLPGILRKRYAPHWDMVGESCLQARIAILDPENGLIGAMEHECGAAFGFEERDPTADMRLLQFCLGIPDSQFAREGRERMLVRRALHPLLPPPVRDAISRGYQASDFEARLIRELPRLRQVIATLGQDSRSCDRLDIGALREVERCLMQGPWDAQHAFRAIAVGQFLLGQQGSGFLPSPALGALQV